MNSSISKPEFSNFLLKIAKRKEIFSEPSTDFISDSGKIIPLKNIHNYYKNIY